MVLSLGCDSVDRAIVGQAQQADAENEVDAPEDPYPDCSLDHSTCASGFGTNAGLPEGACSSCLCDVACSADWHCAAADADATPSCTDGRCLLHCDTDANCPAGMACVDHYDQLGGPICMWVADVCDENNSP